jgi:hypothetical protein
MIEVRMRDEHVPDLGEVVARLPDAALEGCPGLVRRPPRVNQGNAPSAAQQVRERVAQRAVRPGTGIDYRPGRTCSTGGSSSCVRS